MRKLNSWAAHVIPRAGLAIFTLLATPGCHGEATPYARAPAVSAYRDMDGVWDVILRLERPMSFAEEGRAIPRNVEGRITLLEDKTGRPASTRIRVPTFVGVYDIDVGALGLPAGELGAVPGVVARRAPSAPAASNAHTDSVFLVMNPEMPGHSVRLSGVIAGDTARGSWTGESPLGGGGSFVLQRHPPAGVVRK